MADEVLMDFGDAMRAVTDGLSVHRDTWDDKAARVQVVQGELAIFTDGAWHPWLIQEDDVKAKDWAV